VVIVPACLVGLALTTMGFAASREGRTLDASAHRAFDLILLGVLVLGAIVSAIVGDSLDGTALLVAGAALLFALWAFTIYSSAEPEPDGAVAVTGDESREGSYTG